MLRLGILYVRGSDIILIYVPDHRESEGFEGLLDRLVGTKLMGGQSGDQAPRGTFVRDDQPPRECDGGVSVRL